MLPQCILERFLLLALNLKFLHKNVIFWVWAQLTKWRLYTLVSTPNGILKKRINIEYFIAILTFDVFLMSFAF